MSDLIDRQAAIDAIDKHCDVICQYSKKQRSVMCGACSLGTAFDVIENLPSAQPYTEAEIQKMQELEQAELQKAYECGRASAQPEIIRCKDCKYWRQQTNYAGAPLSFGFCESDKMWRSLYGETYEVSHIDTDDDFYCGYAERREDD